MGIACLVTLLSLLPSLGFAVDWRSHSLNPAPSLSSSFAECRHTLSLLHTLPPPHRPLQHKLARWHIIVGRQRCDFTRANFSITFKSG